jgi:hypothetical protein
MAGPEGLSRRRAVNMHALLATGVKADEAPEILGVVITNPKMALRGQGSRAAFPSAASCKSTWLTPNDR